MFRRENKSFWTWTYGSSIGHALSITRIGKYPVIKRAAFRENGAISSDAFWWYTTAGGCHSYLGLDKGEIGGRFDVATPPGAVGQRVYPFRSWRDVQNVSEMKSSFLLVNTPIWHVDTIDGCIAGMISGMQQQTLQLPDICLVCQQCKIEFSLQSIQTRVKPWKLIHCMSKIQIKIVIFRV